MLEFMPKALMALYALVGLVIGVVYVPYGSFSAVKSLVCYAAAVMSELTTAKNKAS
jgi:hypothetical protein